MNAHLVENYPGIPKISGYDFATTLYNQVKDLGGEFKFETVVKITKDMEAITSSGTYKAKSIILATGALSRKLNLERETEFIGKGLSYCATCDGNFFKNKKVAVIGGGNTALEDAIYLSDIASKVYLIHRKDHFRGEDKYVSELKEKENVELVMDANVTSLNGENKIESITLDNGSTIEIDGIFIAVGQEPKNAMFSDVIELTENGYIKSEDGVHTNVNHIYVAGDTRVKNLRQLTTAVSDGAIAATQAIKEMED